MKCIYIQFWRSMEKRPSSMYSIFCISTPHRRFQVCMMMILHQKSEKTTTIPGPKIEISELYPSNFSRILEIIDQTLQGHW